MHRWPSRVARFETTRNSLPVRKEMESGYLIFRAAIYFCFLFTWYMLPRLTTVQSEQLGKGICVGTC